MMLIHSSINCLQHPRNTIVNKMREELSATNIERGVRQKIVKSPTCIGPQARKNLPAVWERNTLRHEVLKISLCLSPENYPLLVENEIKGKSLFYFDRKSSIAGHL